MDGCIDDNTNVNRRADAKWDGCGWNWDVSWRCASVD